VVVVHGLVNFPADVYLDGAATPALSGFEFRRTTDPLAMPVGLHRADLRRSGEPATAAATLSGNFTVAANQRITVAALLDTDAKPTWLVFPDDSRVADPTRGEIRFRHFAAAGPVRVTMDGAVVLDGAANLARAGQLSPLVVAPGVHRIGVTDTAGGTVLVPEADVVVTAGGAVNLYLTGQPTSGLALLQEAPAAPDLQALQAVPSQVPGGDSGLRATSGASGRSGASDGLNAPGSLLAASLAAAVGLGIALRSAAARRARPVSGHRRLRRGPGRSVVLGVGLVAVTTGCGGGAAPGSSGRPGPTAPVAPVVPAAAARPIAPSRPPAPAAATPAMVFPLPSPQPAVESPALAAASPTAWGDRLPAGSVAVPAERVVPVRVRIPALAVDAPVVAVGVRPDGALDLPADATTVAWFSGGAAPGESGSSVLAAHVDHAGVPGAFFRLEELPSGAEVLIDRSDGTSLTVRTQAPAERIAKSSLPLDEVFRRGEAPVVTLITCGGAFDATARSYRDNVLVRAGGEGAVTG
jgi:hypothetical protein